MLLLRELQSRREELHHLAGCPGILNYEQACGFVHSLRVVMPWSTQGYPLPSLRSAYKGEVAREPGPIWDWKDKMPLEKRAYYGSLLKKGKVLLEPAIVPAFYRSSGRTGDPEDYLVDYGEGTLSFLGKQVMDVVRQGPILGQDLKLRLKQLGVDARRLTAELDELQSRFYITKVSVVNEGRRYGYVWGLVDEAWPEVIPVAMSMSKADARSEVVHSLVHASVFASGEEVVRMTGWPEARVHDALQRLQETGRVSRVAGDYWALYEEYLDH